MRGTLLSAVAVIAVSVVVSTAIWLVLDETADAQSGMSAPANLKVSDGANPGEALISWDAAAGASGYRLRWVGLDPLWDAHFSGANWYDLIQTLDVGGSDASSHLLASGHLTPGGVYMFGVGAVRGDNAEPHWSEWQTWKMRGPDGQAVLATALAISRNAGALNAATRQRAALIPAQLVQDRRLDLNTQLKTLAESGHSYRVGRITVLVNRLVSNTEAIQAGRRGLLRAALAEKTSRERLTDNNRGVLFPNANASADAALYDLLTSAGGEDPADSVELSADELLRYSHLSSLSSNVALAHTFLVVASLMQDPTFVARIQEAYDSVANSIDRDIAYLSELQDPDLEEQVLVLARRAWEAGSGDENNYFVRLERRLKLTSDENALIRQNAGILAQLLDEIDGLAADVEAGRITGGPAERPEQPTGIPGVTASGILFGQSAALTGPSDELGRGMQVGIQAAFKEANDAGGVNGRALTLVTEDDSYEPDAAFENARKLLDADQVFGLIGSVGTPTSRAASPVAEAQGAPFVGAFTGAQLLRSGDLTNVLNLRASYHDETERMVDYLQREGISKVAVLYQNDSYGVDGLEGVQNALAKDGRQNMELVESWYYRRNTAAVNAAVFRIARANPEAVIIIGAYQPAAEAIEKLRMKLDPAPIFMNVSFVGSNALAEELGDAGAGVYVTQVVPLPTDESNAVVAKYVAALSAYDANSEPGFVSLEGYLVGRLAIAALDACGAEVTRACFLREARGLDSIDGFDLTYQPGENQGSDTVFLTRINSAGEYELAE